jgi:MFS family permease
MQRKIIRQYYVLSCLFNAGGMSIISAIYVTFLIHNGLNLLQVNLVNTVFFLTLFICEIPTGAFADIFGRKTSFVAACGLLSVSMFVYGKSHTFVGFVLAEIIAAVGMTFRSGAFQAWLVDSLKHHGYDGEYNHIFGREGLIRQIGGGIGAVVGSYLAAHDPALPWFVGGTVMAVTTLFAFIIMKEDYFVRGVFSWKRGLTSMRDIALSSVRYGTQHKAVRFILIITGIQIFAVQALNMYWQPFFRNHKVSEQHLGFLYTAMMTALAAGAFIVSRLDCKGKEKKMIIRSQICTGVLVIAAVLVPGLPFIVILFIVHEMPRGCLTPLVDSYLQKRIPSAERATIASFCAIAPHIGGAIGLVVSGLIAQFCGISVAWIVAGGSLIVGAVLVERNGDSN